MARNGGGGGGGVGGVVVVGAVVVVAAVLVVAVHTMRVVRPPSDYTSVIYRIRRRGRV